MQKRNKKLTIQELRDKFYFVTFFILFSAQIYSDKLDDLIVKKKPQPNHVIIELIKAGLDDETDNENKELANLICKNGGISSYKCDRYDAPKTIAHAICSISGKSIYNCTKYDGPKTIAQSICIAGGKSIYNCTRYDGPKTIAQGICIAGGKSISSCARWDGPKTVSNALDEIPTKDRTFWWDLFRDQYGNYQWRCRGGQTKQFASDSRCSRVTKDDERWPG
jgi:hypothetical protein